MNLTNRRVNRLYGVQLLLLITLVLTQIFYDRWDRFQNMVDVWNQAITPTFSIIVNLLAVLLLLMGIRTALAHKTKHGYVFLIISIIFALISFSLSPTHLATFYPVLLTLLLMYIIEGLILYGHYLVCLHGCPIPPK